jgi:hypothetical protein
MKVSIKIKAIIKLQICLLNGRNRRGKHRSSSINRLKDTLQMNTASDLLDQNWRQTF